jgi:ADP-ribosylglycohydrolase
MLPPEMARRLGHINGYAEGTDGAVFVAGMISIAFVENDPRAIVRQAAMLIHPHSPYRKCLDMIMAMADAGSGPDRILRAIDDRWGIEYPATNNAVVNGGFVATSVWFGEGDFQKAIQLAVHAADFADTDCNAANSESVVAAMHGMKALPPEQVAELHDRIKGREMGSLPLTLPWTRASRNWPVEPRSSASLLDALDKLVALHRTDRPQAAPWF